MNFRLRRRLLISPGLLVASSTLRGGLYERASNGDFQDGQWINRTQSMPFNTPQNA